MSKKSKSSVTTTIVVVFFAVSAVLTYFVGKDAEKGGEGKDNTELTDGQLGQADEAKRPSSTPVTVNEAIEGDPYEELNSLIGLESVKEEVNSLVNLVKIQKKREAQGMKNSSMSYHCVFTGSPGTGKTTVARILARIYKDLGVLKSGHLVETDRSGLVAGYLGQTATKTNAVIDSALNGVLFIDEAYALTENSQDSYGDEAIATLLKRMEDDRDKLVVIVAGYTDEMKRFIDSNPGLQSRFTRYIDFPDYSADELYKIYLMRAKKYSYVLSDEADEFLRSALDETVRNKSRNFGNARYVRNLFEKCITNQANRLAKKSDPTDQELSELTIEDVEKAYKTVQK